MNTQDTNKTSKCISKIGATLLALLLSVWPAQLIVAAGSSDKKPEGVQRVQPERKAISIAPRKQDLRSVKRTLSFTSTPQDLEFFNCRVFPEPLVPMNNNASPEESQDLARALLAFDANKDPDDLSNLSNFLSKYPNSRWRSSLETNIARRSFDVGHFKDALKHWTSAWILSKKETLASKKSVADDAISNLVLLEARLGLTDSLDQHISEISHRPLSGTVELKVKNSKDGLWMQRHRPDVAYRCGPYAACRVANLMHHTGEYTKQIKKAVSTSKGTNMSQVQELGRTLGLDLKDGQTRTW